MDSFYARRPAKAIANYQSLTPISDRRQKAEGRKQKAASKNTKRKAEGRRQVPAAYCILPTAYWYSAIRNPCLPVGMAKSEI
jgi:hypothetical protein